MTIRKRDGSPYYWIRFSFKGRHIEESTKTVDLKLARLYEAKRLLEIKDELINGTLPQKTWKEASERWLKEKHLKRTIKQDKVYLNSFIKTFKNICLDRITKDMIEELAQKQEAKGLSPASINRQLALIKSILNACYKHWDWVAKVPYIQLRKEQNSTIRWLTKEEAIRLLSQLPLHLKNMAHFSLVTGLRASNVTQLKWSQIHNTLLVIPASESKNGKAFSIPLNQEALEILKVCTNDKEFVFIYKGSPILQPSSKAWRKALKRAGIENFRWHDLRHTWASWHAQSGTSLQELKLLGGWSSLQMVLRYAHLSIKTLEQAANRLGRLDNKGDSAKSEM